MTQSLGVYDPIFYAQEALILLYKNLMFGSRVYRGYDRTPQEKGSTISIRRPTTFTATDMPSSATDLNPDTVNITLNKWKGVVFALTDKELSFTKTTIIDEHIAPAAYAVADAIDQSIGALYSDIPWYASNSSPVAVADLTAVRKIMVTNAVPMRDPSKLHIGLTPTIYKEALDLASFSQWQGAGTSGVDTQTNATLGSKFGLNVFENQNYRTHTAGVSADAAGALVGNHALGATTVTFDGVTAGGTFKAGDTFLITGDTQRYAFTENATADGGGVVAATGISPPLKAAALDNAVVTVTLVSGDQSVAFHRDCFALAMAPLSDLGNQLGAKIASVVDENSGLTLRSRLWYDGGNAKVYVGIDALWGVKTLNPNLGVRMVD